MTLDKYQETTRRGHLNKVLLFSETNPACYVQTCEQFIIGRDLTYKEALNIVQNEIYLKVADIERVARKKKRSLQLNEGNSSELENNFRSKRETSDETFKSALQRLSREVYL